MILETLKKSFGKNASFFCFLNTSLSESVLAILRHKLVEAKIPKNGFLFSTSGTSSGIPRWVVHSEKSLLANAAVVVKTFGLQSQDRLLLSLPLYHVGGFGILARAHLVNATVEVLGAPEGRGLESLHPEFRPKWNSESFVQEIISKKISWTSLVPTQVFDVVNLGVQAPSCLKGIWVGGDRLENSIFRRGLQLGWPLLKTYGMTETGSMFAGLTLDHISGFLGSTDNSEFEDLCEQGLPLFEGWSLEEKSAGKFLVQGPGLFESYLGEEKLAPFFGPDLLELDSNGGVKVKGRGSEIVKILGEFVNLADLEIKISKAFPSLTGNFCILDSQESRRGRALNFYFEKNKVAEDDLSALKAWTTQNFSAWEILKNFVPIETMPRNEMGKIQKNRLSGLSFR